MNVLIHDLGFALRQLRKSPGFLLTVLLTLALGIGANAAIFTLVNAVLRQNLPVADPQSLVRLGDENQCCVTAGTHDSGNYAMFSTDFYDQLRKSAPEFEDLAAMQAGFVYRPLTARRDGTQDSARSSTGEFVSGNYFRTFGLQPAAGRLLLDSDNAKGAPSTAVMSYETWHHDYNADSSVIGGTFWINTKPVTVIGVAPRGFYGDRMSPNPPDFYLPVQSMPSLADAPYVNNPKFAWLYLVGRVKPGVSRDALQQKVTAAFRQVSAPLQQFSGDNGKALARAHIVLTPGGQGIQDLQEQYASHLHLLMAISGLVLLIACANIANLLLVRGMNRRMEMSVRTALGAQRSRIVRQLLTESILLAGLGGLAGLVVAYAGARMLLVLAFPGAERLTIQASPSLPVFAFAFGLSFITGILFGVAPAWISAQAKPADALRTGSRTTTSGASLLQKSLVVLQSALSLILLVGAGLFTQSLGKLQNTDMKLDATNRYIIHLNPQAAGYKPSQLGPLYQAIQDRFHALPGVVHVSLAIYTPMEDNNWSDGIQIQGQPFQSKVASFTKATPEYFDSVGTRLVMGRVFRPQDTPNAPPVAVVNQAFVKEFFKPGTNPIGHRIGPPGPGAGGAYEIVGVVEDTAYTTVRFKDHSMYFLPILQRAPHDEQPIDEDISLYAGAMVLQVAHPTANLDKLVQSTLSSINPNMTVVKFETFSDQIASRFTEERLLARLTLLFGALALLLAAVGLYGVTAYAVVRRTSEIGIRMALGAERSGVVAMVLRGAMLQAAIGLVIGIPVALFCVRFVKSQLYEITSANVGVMVFAIGTLAFAACIAGLIPARRAASINPVQALRSE